MKSFRINLMDLTALILIVLSFFAPFIGARSSINGEVLTLLINCYLIGYLAYLISFMESKKVLGLALPLLIYSGFLALFMRSFSLSFDRQSLDNLIYIISNLYDVIFVVFCFFIIEIILSRIIGPNASFALAILALILYYFMQNTRIIPFDFYYKDLLVYFFFFLMGTRIRQAIAFNNLLFILAFLLFAGEIYIYIYFNYYPGFYFSIIILTYLILKQSPEVEETNINRQMFFAYLYPYKLVYVLLKGLIDASPLVITIISVLVIYVIGQLLYKIRVKFLDYILLGSH